MIAEVCVRVCVDCDDERSRVFESDAVVWERVAIWLEGLIVSSACINDVASQRR
jgi:hypothetical protein